MDADVRREPSAIGSAAGAPAILSRLQHAHAFVGRSRELDSFRSALHEAVAGHGGLTLISGESGIGKTRLLSEMAALARSAGARVLWGTCAEDTTGRAYGPFREAIEGYLRTAEIAALADVLGSTASVIARFVPLVRDRLGKVAAPVALQPDEERTRLFDAVSQLMIALMGAAPLVVVVDDLHWADLDTVGLLSHVARTTPGMLLVGAYRSGDVDQEGALAKTLAQLRRQPSFEELHLQGLTSADTESLLIAMAPPIPNERAGRVDPMLVSAIIERTRGNPFFVRSLAQHLVEEGALHCGENGWHARVPLDEIGIPEGVRQLVQRRLKRLTEDARRFLTAGAVMGTTFGFEVAAAVADLTEERALAVVDEVLGAQVVEGAPSLDTYRFTHALVRQSLYEALNPSRQVRSHRRIAETIVQVYGDRANDYAGEVARHYHRSASLPGAEPGVVHALLAADEAELAYAHDDTATFLRIALDLLPRNDIRRARLFARLGMALSWACHFEEARQVMGEAGDLMARVEGHDAAADYLAEAAMALWEAGSPRDASALTPQGLRYAGERRDLTWVHLMVHDIIGQEARDPSHPGIVMDTPERLAVAAVIARFPVETSKYLWVLDTHGFNFPKSRQDVLARMPDNAYYLMAGAGEFRHSVRVLGEVVARCQREGRLVDTVNCLAMLARAHNALGALTAARATYDRAVTLARRFAGLPHRMLPLAMTKLEMRLVVDEGWEEFLREAAEESPPISETPWVAAAVRAQAAWIFARVGQAEMALGFLQSILDPLERAPAWAITYEQLAFNAASTLWLLQRTEHIDVIERSLRDKILAADFRYPLADPRLSLAHLSALQGRHDEAVEWFAKARTVLDEEGARPLRAIVDFDEGLMYQRRGATGDLGRAQPLLENALAQFQSIGMPGWIRRVAEILEFDTPRATDGHRAPKLPDRSESEVRLNVPPTRQVPVAGETSERDFNTFRCEGQYWTVAYAGQVVRLKESKGIQYLAHLLRHPNEELLALDLAGVSGVGGRGASKDQSSDPRPPIPDPRHPGLSSLDAQAKHEYRQRLQDLRAELTEAEQFNDLGRVAKLKEEIDFLARQLNAAVDLYGKDRKVGTAAERARLMVTKRIKSVLKTLDTLHPTLAHHLRACVKTGYYCTYVPPPGDPVVWQTQG